MAQTPLLESHTEMTEVVLPNHSNEYGRALGGVILRWMDICGAIAAMRFADGLCVTAAMDHVDFIAPIEQGEIVNLEGYVYEAGRTSLEVVVDVTAEQIGGDSDNRATTTSFFTFVAIEEDGTPRPVPAVSVESDRERSMQAEAIERRASRRREFVEDER